MKINNATPNLTPNLNNKNQVAFSGKLPVKETIEIAKKNPFAFKNLFDLDKTGHMSRTLFIINGFIFLLGGRVLRSRDNNEKREAITRDVPTIVVVAMGIPVVQKWLAKRMQEKTGLALTYEGDIAKGSQIQEWYKYDEKTTTGFEGFSKRLSDMGGNLKKIFSRLDDDTKSKLSNFSNDNDKFISELSKNKELKTSIANKFKNGGNKALEEAAFLHTVPTLLGFGVTLSLIGIMIPKLNIAITARINKKKAMEEKLKENNQQLATTERTTTYKTKPVDLTEKVQRA